MSKIKNKNLTIKTLALFISILLWSYVRSEINPDIIREFKGVNVEFMNERLLTESGLIIIQPEEIKISVKVSGRRNDVNSITSEDITAQVDLAGATKGTKKIPISVNVPFKVALENVSENYASFEIDNMITVKKDVEINTIGSSKNNTIKNTLISPQTIEVSGPSIYINKISKVVVDIDTNKILSDDTMKLPVKVIDKEGNIIKQVKTNVDMVEVSLSLLKSKRVIIKPKVSGDLNEDYKIKSIDTDLKTIVIMGLEEDIKNITEIETEDIDISNIDKDEKINVNLKLPVGVEVEDGKEKVAVNIKVTNIALEEKKTREILVPLEQMDFENLKEGLKVNLENNPDIKNINVKLSGDENELNILNSEDLNLTLDLNELEEGIHELEITVSSLKDVIIESISPKNIKVEIEDVE